ncbi:hypothetical protein Tco_1347740 [Tanacetum coccineum]
MLETSMKVLFGLGGVAAEIGHKEEIWLVLCPRNGLEMLVSCLDMKEVHHQVDLIGDEDSTNEDGDIGVLVSLGDEIFSEGKKSQESSIGDSDNTGDGGKTAGRAIITWGGGIASLISELEGTIVE